MATPSTSGEARVAVLVDCDNVSPEVLERALRVSAQFGRIVLRRGYGNHVTRANRWQDTLLLHAFTPSLQYQYASGKNTSDRSFTGRSHATKAAKLFNSSPSSDFSSPSSWYIEH